MSKTKLAGASIAAVAVAIIGAAVLRRQAPVDPHPPKDPPSRSAVPAPAAERTANNPGLAQTPGEPVRSQPPQEPQGSDLPPELWREVQEIVAAITGDEGRRRDFLKAFVQMVARVRDIEKAGVRYRIEPEKTVIEIPAFREQGRLIYADWLKTSLAVLTPEEGTRFTRSPDFELGKLSPELDLLRAANLFSGSRHGKEMKPDFFWDETTRIDAQRIDGGKVQVRVGTAERTSFSQFENQQEALNHLVRGYGHLLGPIPQLFR